MATPMRRSAMKPRTVPMPRTPLKSTNTLKKGASLGRFSRGAGDPPNAARKASPRQTGFPPAVRALVWARSAGRCEGCGRWLGERGGQLQHRLARRAGGSRDPVISSPANAARLCGTPQSGCHGRCESRDRHMAMAGWWLASWQDPRTEPVMLFDSSGGGVTVWLGTDGTYLLRPPEAS